MQEENNNKKQFISISIPVLLVKRLEEFMAKHRVFSRSEVLRRAIQKYLDDSKA